VAASGDEGEVDVMLLLVVRVVGLGLEHAWPVSISHRVYQQSTTNKLWLSHSLLETKGIKG